MKALKTKLIDVGELEQGLFEGNRIALAKAITLVESDHVDDQQKAEELIENILPRTGNSIRIGITGVPGVGKSTFIEAFGKLLTSQGKKIAVLAVDPSSQKTKGSILGDKTRMEELSKDPQAFIRPSATRGSLGGVTNSTRESILLCEAAGFDVIIIETVGVGQSEIAVREMTDFFLLLALAGAGDELQGIKKGIMEMADGIAITKADGENIKATQQALADYRHAIHFFRSADSGWTPSVLTTSALENKGMQEVWTMIQKFESLTKGNSFFNEQRKQQEILSFHQAADQLIKKYITDQSSDLLSTLEKKVNAKQLSPRRASRMLFEKMIDLKK